MSIKLHKVFNYFSQLGSGFQGVNMPILKERTAKTLHVDIQYTSSSIPLNPSACVIALTADSDSHLYRWYLTSVLPGLCLNVNNSSYCIR